MKIVKEHINEKFTEDSDPIHDMGIGHKHFLKKELEKETIQSTSQSYDAYFKSYCDLSYTKYDSIIVRTLWHTIAQYIGKENYMGKENVSIQESFEFTCEHEFEAEELSMKEKIKIRKKLAEILKKKYYLDVNPLYESINEKFTEDGDPIHNMNIGLIHKIREWITEELLKRGVHGENPIRNYTMEDFHINDNLTIDIDGRFDISWPDVRTLPDYIKLNHIKGDFCSWLPINILKRSGPKIVDGNYIVYSHSTEHLTMPMIRKICYVKGVVSIYGHN